MGEDPRLDNYKIITLLDDFTEGHKCGGCTSHARECGADVGIFLRIRECIIVIHSKVTRGEAIHIIYGGRSDVSFNELVQKQHPSRTMNKGLKN